MLTAHFRVLGHAITTISGAEQKNVQPIQTTPSSNIPENLNQAAKNMLCRDRQPFSYTLTVFFFWEPGSTWKKKIDQIVQQPGVRVVEL